MKRIGILGGVSPESSVSYYLRITREYTSRFGDYGYPEILIHSVSFQRFVDWQKTGNWDAMAAEMIRTFHSLSAGGADFGLIAANTLHRIFHEVERESPIPLIHIVDPTASQIAKQGISRVGLLGTKYTMEGEFYRDRLAQYGIEALIPDAAARQEIHRVIYEELTKGAINEKARQYYASVIRFLVDRGAEGIILGCTEIPLLVTQDDSPVALFDTASLHADAALARALEN
jgi:aspartate racemase